MPSRPGDVASIMSERLTVHAGGWSLILGAVALGSHLALRASHPGSSLLALQCAVLASLGMMLGLMRWPTVHWRLAELYAGADSSQRPSWMRCSTGSILTWAISSGSFSASSPSAHSFC